MIASSASFCIAGASISLAFVGCGAPPNTPIIWAGRNDTAKSDTEEVFRLKEKVSKLEEKVPILEDENASLKEEIVCQKTQVSNLTEENAKHKEEIEKLRLQVQQSRSCLRTLPGRRRHEVHPQPRNSPPRSHRTFCSEMTELSKSATSELQD